ncbi:unnamed protein product, partial [Meganyctiphanes norvegica]
MSSALVKFLGGVCGQGWMTCYLDSLDDNSKKRVREFPGTTTFRFGNDATLNSLKKLEVPCMIAGKNKMISTDVVSSDIPLLLGETVHLQCTPSGHYFIPLLKPNVNCVQNIHQVLHVIDDKNLGDPKLMKLVVFSDASHANLPDGYPKCFIDNKSLWENAHSTKGVSERRLRIDIAAIKEMLERKEISAIKWVETSHQLSDCFTKKGVHLNIFIYIILNCSYNFICIIVNITLALLHASLNYYYVHKTLQFEIKNSFLAHTDCLSPESSPLSLGIAVNVPPGEVDTKIRDVMTINPHLIYIILRNIKKIHSNLAKFLNSNLIIAGGIPNMKESHINLNGYPDIVCGTPGRLEDLINSGQLSLQNCRFFVLDEADGLLKQGHEKLVNNIHQTIPKITPDGKRLQMVVCSATLHSFEIKLIELSHHLHPHSWQDLQLDILDSIGEYSTKGMDTWNDNSWATLRKHVTTDGVHQKDNVRPGNNTPETLSEAVKMLKGEYCIKAIETHNMDKAIIFCRTKLDCDNMERYFNQLGGGARNPTNPYSCVCLHGDRKPNERKQNLDNFKQGMCKFLICTDVAARGIDVNGLPFIINVTLPDEKSNYVHRIGRVGRAERMGLAISLVSAVPEKVSDTSYEKRKNYEKRKIYRKKVILKKINVPHYLASLETEIPIICEKICKLYTHPIKEKDGGVGWG